MFSHSLPSFVADKHTFFSRLNVDTLTIAQVEELADKDFRVLTKNRESMIPEQENLYAILPKKGNDQRAFWLYCYKVSFELKAYYETYSPEKLKFKKYKKLCEDIASRINGQAVVTPPRVSLLAQLNKDVDALATKTRLTELSGWFNMQRLSTRFSIITLKLSLLFAREKQLLDNLEWLFGRQFNIALLDTPLGIYNALSVGLFGFRFLLQLAMMLKHTLLPQGAEANLTMVERFYEEFKNRHHQMTNDVVWGTVNSLCNFAPYFGISAPVTNALMLIFTVFDLVWLAYSLNMVELEYSLKKNEYITYRDGLTDDSARRITTAQLEKLEQDYTKKKMMLIFYMLAASMMIAGVGASANEKGIRMAVAAEGPRPGKTPTSVPSRQPIRAKRRFIGWSAMANPFSSKCSVSIAPPRTRRGRSAAGSPAT